MEFSTLSSSRIVTSAGVAEFKVIWTWPLPSLGSFRSVKLDATLFDEYGVEWSGSLSTTLNFRPGGGSRFNPLDVPMRKARIDVAALALPVSSRAKMTGRVNGPLLVHDIDEMLESLSAGLPSAAICLAGKTLDGLLKVTGERDGWWDPSWDGSQLGTLVQTGAVVGAIKAAMGPGFLERLKGSVLYVRHTGAHQRTLP